MVSKKNASMEALENEASEPIEKEQKKMEIAPEAQPSTKGRPNTKGDRKQFPAQIPVKAHRKLSEYAFFNNVSMNDCILEGLDLFFKKKGLKTIKQLNSE